MASDLLVVACRTLEDVSTSPALKSAAAEALLAAVSGGLPLPNKAARLIWNLWRACPANRSWRHAQGIGDLRDESIRSEVIAILDAEDSGEELRDLAVDVLVGAAHAAHVDDRFILGLIERVRTGEGAREAVRVIEAVHAARAISVEIIRMIRDRWAASDVAVIRETSISVGGQIAEPDVTFIEKMLADPDVDVRSTMAHALEMDHPGRELGLGLVEARLRADVHPRARVALLRAQASLLEDTHVDGRRRRRR